MIDRLPVWQIVRDHSPRNTAPNDIEDRVEDFALGVSARSTASCHVCFWDDRSNDFPLWIRQTAWIARHAEFLPDLSTKVQPNICLKLFFRQALRALRILDRPFEGVLKVVFPRNKIGSKPHSLFLNFLMMDDAIRGMSPTKKPYIATTNDGKSYRGAFQLVGALPVIDLVTEVTEYDKLIELLGEPNHHESEGVAKNMWEFDTVSWRYFAPVAGKEMIDVLEVCVARKIRVDGKQKGNPLVISKTVSQGRMKITNKPALPPLDTL